MTTIYGLFNDALTSRDYKASSVLMVNNELKRIWKETGMALLEVISRHFSGENEYNHVKPHSGWWIRGLRFQPGIFQIQHGSIATRPWRCEVTIIAYRVTEFSEQWHVTPCSLEEAERFSSLLFILGCCWDCF
jgi:hypothetical protein